MKLFGAPTPAPSPATTEPDPPDNDSAAQDALRELGSRLDAVESAQSAAPNPEPATTGQQQDGEGDASIERGDLDADDNAGVDGFTEPDDGSSDAAAADVAALRPERRTSGSGR